MLIPSDLAPSKQDVLSELELPCRIEEGKAKCILGHTRAPT